MTKTHHYFPAITTDKAARPFDRMIIRVTYVDGRITGWACYATYRKAFDSAYTLHKEDGGLAVFHAANDGQRPEWDEVRDAMTAAL